MSLAHRFGMALIVSTVALVAVSGCTGHVQPSASKPSERSTPNSSEATASPVSIPIPDGCPTAEELGEAYISDANWAEPVDAALLDREVATEIPSGGCAYAAREVHTAENSDATYREVFVFYFNLGEPAKLTQSELALWGEQVGGTPADEILNGEPTGKFSTSDLVLPDDFSGWTGSHVTWVDGENSWYFDPEDDVIPEYTGGAGGRVTFDLSSERVDALVGGEVVITETAMPTVQIEDASGYTYVLSLDNPVTEATVSVADALPGKANVTFDFTISGRVVNTTEERNAPGVSGIAVQPAWEPDSAVCQVFPSFGVYCGTDTAGRLQFSGDDSAQLAVGESADIAIVGSVTREVPEADAEALAEALRVPTGWIVAAPGAEGTLTDPCVISVGASQVPSAWTADLECTP